MSARSWELVTANEPSVITKTPFDAFMVEDTESNGCFSYAPCTDKSDGVKVFSEVNDLIDQLIAPETGLWRQGSYFPLGNPTQV